MGVIVLAPRSSCICKINLSVFLKSRTGSGRISACGGNGYGGGGGGRVSVDVFSRHDDPKIFVHGETRFVLLPCLCPFIFLKRSRSNLLTGKCFFIINMLYSFRGLPLVLDKVILISLEGNVGSPFACMT